MGAGSFFIRKSVIDLLVARQNLSGAHLAAYLVLARFTDELGIFTTAGATAIQKNTGLSWKRANEVLADLMALRGLIDPFKGNTKRNEGRLLWPIDEYCALIKEDPPSGRTTYALSNLASGSDENAWFSNELVDGYGAFKTPLKTLIKYGDTAFRLLLMMYGYNDMENFGGVNPYYVCEKFSLEDIDSAPNGFDLYHAVSENSYTRFAQGCLGLSEWPKDGAEKEKAIAPFWQALKGLQSSGLVYPVVTVFNDDPSKEKNSSASLLYVLHTKTQSGYVPKGEDGLASDTARISSDFFKRPVCDSQGRFYGRYAVIVPAGMPVNVTGIFRLRFRVSNPANAGVKDAWRMIADANNEAKAWMNAIEGKKPEKEGVTSLLSMGNNPTQSPVSYALDQELETPF
mgnify:CR=1 FL=1